MFLPNSGAGQPHVFEIGNDGLAAIFHVKDFGKILNLLIEIGHVPQLLAAAVHISCGFLVAHMPGET